MKKEEEKKSQSTNPASMLSGRGVDTYFGESIVLSSIIKEKQIIICNEKMNTALPDLSKGDLSDTQKIFFSGALFFAYGKKETNNSIEKIDGKKPRCIRTHRYFLSHRLHVCEKKGKENSDIDDG